LLANVASAQITPEDVASEIAKYDIKHPEIVLAQSILETGWYKCSDCSLDVNNLFGFFYKGKFLGWDTWQESVKYYAWWQGQLYKGGDYYEFLKRIGYFTSKNYIVELKKIVKQYE
jgi:flagellum-specific peptidoglycan hydrolase FlgJ